MPTSTEAVNQYVPRPQRSYISQQTNQGTETTATSPNSVVKSIDVNLLVDVTSQPAVATSSTSMYIWIAVASLVGLCIVAAAITVPILLINTTSTTTLVTSSTTPTTTPYPYPSGISLLGPSASLINISNPSSSSPYYNVSWLYYAQGYNETITFAIQNNPSYTQIDDVSVLYGTQQLLCNGGFEYGNMNCWQGANHLSSGSAHDGTYCYNDGVVGAPDYVWQSFNGTPGALLYISFWIAWGGSGSGVYTNVTIYP